MSFIQLSDDIFEKQFRPVVNLEIGKGAYQFNAYDSIDNDFLQFMAINHPDHVWTRIDSDNSCIFNINGW